MKEMSEENFEEFDEEEEEEIYIPIVKHKSHCISDYITEFPHTQNELKNEETTNETVHNEEVENKKVEEEKKNENTEEKEEIINQSNEEDTEKEIKLQKLHNKRALICQEILSTETTYVKCLTGLITVCIFISTLNFKKIKKLIKFK